MSIESLKAMVPDWAKDIRLNIGSVPTSTSLSEQQLWGTLLATAIASRNQTVLAAIDEEASDHLSTEAKTAAKSAAAVMSMNNIYYRSSHLLGGDYASMPARLRMTVIGNPGVSKEDFELWCLAVSAINGCENCLVSHEKVVVDKGLTAQQVQDAVRVAAIVHSVAVTIEAEDHFYAATSL